MAGWGLAVGAGLVLLVEAIWAYAVGLVLICVCLVPVLRRMFQDEGTRGPALASGNCLPGARRLIVGPANCTGQGQGDRDRADDVRGVLGGGAVRDRNLTGWLAQPRRPDVSK